MSNKIPKNCFVRPLPRQSLTASLRDVVRALKQPSQEKQETNSKVQGEDTDAESKRDEGESNSDQPKDGTDDMDNAASGATNTDKKKAMLPPPQPRPSKAKINAPPPKVPAKKTSEDSIDNASTTAVVHDGHGPEDGEYSALVPAGGGAYDPPGAGPNPTPLPYPAPPKQVPYPTMGEDGTWTFPMANDGINGTFQYKHQLVLNPSAPSAANAAESAPEPEAEPAKAKGEPACIVCKGDKHLRDFSNVFGSDGAFMCYACFQHNTGAEQEIFWFHGLAVEG